MIHIQVGKLKLHLTSFDLAQKGTGYDGEQMSLHMENNGNFMPKMSIIYFDAAAALLGGGNYPKAKCDMRYV